MNKAISYIKKKEKKLKQKIQLKIIPLVKKTSRIYQSLLSFFEKHSVRLVHLGIIMVAIALSGLNFLSREKNVYLDSSILFSLIKKDADFEVVKNEALLEKKSKSQEKNYLFTSALAAQVSSPLISSQKENSIEEIKSLSPQKTTPQKEALIENVSAPSQKQEKSKKPSLFKYTVQEGDTIFKIAERFGIDAATILQENNLYADDIIKPGMNITILPISGTTERVDKGETLEAIAQKHDAKIDKILAYNNLINKTDIEEGQILIIPDGKREIKERPRPVKPEPESYFASNDPTPTPAPKVSPGPYSPNKFPWGYCTWYAASRRGDVTWSGNAGAWLINAQAAGRATGRTPAVGAIMVTSESWWGHVAIVEAVNGDQVTVSEMNYVGYGIISSRTISNSSSVIKGYIY